MSKITRVLMASLIPLAVVAIVGNVKMIRDIVFPAVPRIGGGE